MLSIDTRKKSFSFFFCFYLWFVFFSLFSALNSGFCYTLWCCWYYGWFCCVFVWHQDIKSLINFVMEFARFSDSWTKRRFYLSNPCWRFCLHTIYVHIKDVMEWIFLTFIWCQFNTIEKWLFSWNSHQSKRVCCLFCLLFLLIFTAETMRLKVIYLPETEKKKNCVEWRHLNENKEKRNNVRTMDWPQSVKHLIDSSNLNWAVSCDSK